PRQRALADLRALRGGPAGPHPLRRDRGQRVRRGHHGGGRASRPLDPRAQRAGRARRDRRRVDRHGPHRDRPRGARHARHRGPLQHGARGRAPRAGQRGRRRSRAAPRSHGHRRRAARRARRPAAAGRLVFLALHGHFYQPPREHPWRGVVEPEPSAAPYQDWNARITAECYAPNTAARLPGAEVNTYEWTSFDFGPTLLAWLVPHAPEVLAALRRADRASRVRTGHGNAWAQAYGHAILPLSTARDVRTQVLWGRADLAHRFGRSPEAMWLPEMAVDRPSVAAPPSRTPVRRASLRRRSTARPTATTIARARWRSPPP